MATVTIESVESVLRSLTDLPAPVSAWRVEVGRDATDDEAIWVWATLADECFEDLTTVDALHDRIREGVKRWLNDDTWIYVRFRGESEEQKR